MAIVLIVALLYWFLPKPYGARHFFIGPKRDGSKISMIKYPADAGQALMDDVEGRENKNNDELFTNFS